MSDLVVEVVPRGGRGDLSGRRLTERLVDRIDDVGDAVVEIGQRLRRRFETEGSEGEPSLAWGLDTVEIAFSMDLEAEAGMIVTRATATAGFEVTITWSRSH